MRRTILLLTASPVDQPKLNLDKEVREIRQGLRRSGYRHQFQLENRGAVRIEDLRQALLHTKPQIVHFCGHGIGSGGLVLEDEQGNTQLVTTEALGNLFKLFRTIECVLLNACYSQIQAQAIVQYVGHVIGMNKEIGDKAAIAFSMGFYDGLGGGRSVEDAYELGCNAIELKGIPEHLTPVLEINPAWSRQLSPDSPEIAPQNIPSSNTDKFVGREGELEHLKQQLQNHNEVVIAAVEGMGGVGKTELAIQYSLRHLQLHNYPGGICWLQAREQDIGLQIVNFARTDLGLKPPDDLELPERVRWCWRNWHQGNTLLVLDDVKNYGDIKPYLPPQPSQFKVLITTRLKLDLAGSLYLEVLQPADALQLLTQLVGEEKVNQESEKAEELCQRLGNLPLALHLVGRYVFKRKISLTKMLERLEGKGLGHAALVVNENDPNWTSDIKRGVAAAFELSWEELSESAQELGCLLSLFAVAPIPWSLVESVAAHKPKEVIPLGLKILQMVGLFKRQLPIKQEPKTLEDSRVELESLHLLEGEDIYQLHQLIQEFLLDKQNNLVNGDEHKYNFCTVMVEQAYKIPKTPILLEINQLAPIIPHLAQTATVYQNWLRDEDLIVPFIGLGHFYRGQGAYAQALPWLEQCASVAKERLGEEHPDVALSYNNLAGLYSSQGRYSDAQPLYEKALSLRQQLLGEEHPDVATSYNNLALLYSNQGRYSDAQPLYEKALSLNQQLLGEEHPHVASSYNNLALLYSNQGRYSDAQPLYEKALSLYQQLLGEEHPDVALSYNNLAGLYLNQGQYSQAQPLYEKALEILEQQLGANHPNTITVKENYQYCLRQADR